jgi:hypothetical protein
MDEGKERNMKHERGARGGGYIVDRMRENQKAGGGTIPSSGKKNKKKRWWLEGRECTKSIAEDEKGTEGCRQQEKNSRDDSR